MFVSVCYWITVLVQFYITGHNCCDNRKEILSKSGSKMWTGYPGTQIIVKRRLSRTCLALSDFRCFRLISFEIIFKSIQPYIYSNSITFLFNTCFSCISCLPFSSIWYFYWQKKLFFQIDSTKILWVLIIYYFIWISQKLSKISNN
jgi:hypothetical protein